MLTQCCLSLGWHRERKDLLALSFKNKNFKLNKKRLAHKNSYNTAWIFTADVNSAYSKWQDQFSVQGFAPLHGKLPADPCDWRSGLLCFPMTYVSQEAHVHRPVPEAASLKASKSPAPWLHGHKHIKKLIHGLSRLTMLPHTNIHVCVYIYIYIQGKQQMSLSYYQEARLGAQSTTFASLWIHTSTLSMEDFITQLSATPEQHTDTGHSLPVLLPTLL